MPKDENLALDLDLFDPEKNVYVPIEPKKRKVQLPKLLEEKPVSRAAMKNEEAQSRARAIRATVAAVALLMMFCALIFTSVYLTMLKMDLNEAKSALSVSESENIRLQMSFNSMMSMDKVEEYAQSQLGMVKRENYQIRYFENSQDSGAMLTKSGEVN